MPAAASDRSSNSSAARQAADGDIEGAAAEGCTKRIASTANALTRVVSPAANAEAEKILEILDVADVVEVVEEVIPVVGVRGLGGISSLGGHAPYSCLVSVQKGKRRCFVTTNRGRG